MLLPNRSLHHFGYGLTRPFLVRRLCLPAEAGVLVLFLMRCNTRGKLLLWCMGEVRRAVLGSVTRLGFDGAIGGLGIDRLRVADLRGRRATTTTAHVVLCLGGVVSGILLHRLAIPPGMVSREILDLLSLRTGNFGRVLQVAVDELLVALVDQGAQVDDRSGDEGQAPEGSELDEPV